MPTILSIADLGWRPFFQQQLNLEEWENARPARVFEHHKTQIRLATADGDIVMLLHHSMPALTVGDWLLVDDTGQYLRCLERHSCFYRKAPGSQVAEQLISANVDTAFIVCALNEDFNLNRLERYLTMVHEAGAEPVIILSKSDLCPDPTSFASRAQALNPHIGVEVLNNQSEEAVKALAPWCQRGKTIALLGSSGAGKSTLINTLLGEVSQATQSVRENDSKGRHTTTSRSLFRMPNKALLLDTPGMRELQLSQSEEGLAATFSDIEALAKNCRFSDCQHKQEPNCAVQTAIIDGHLSTRRFNNYCKLLREQALNKASLAQRRADEKKLQKIHKHTTQQTAKIKGK